MAYNRRNTIRYAANDLDVLEAGFGTKSRAMYGMQPHGRLVGTQVGIDNTSLINRAGSDWILTEVGTAGAKALQAATSALPPFVRYTTGGTQHDNGQIQSAAPGTLGSGTAAAWAPFIAKAGFNIHMRARFQLTTTVANAAFFIGLIPVDTTILSSSAIANNDAIGFYKAASTACVGLVRAGGTSTSTTLGSGFTPTISTWYDLQMLVNGRDSVTFWVDGTETGQTTMTNLPANTVTLALSAAISAGTAAAATLELQSLVCYQEAN
jgi:hypothetical protein